MEGNISITSIARSIGKEVLDNSGNRCGSIKDFLVDHSRLSVPYVLLSGGGSFNPALAESYTAIPVKAVNFENQDAVQLTLNVSAKKLDGIPTIPKAQFENKRHDFLKEIEAYYGAKENFTQSLAISENETEDHQSYEGSAESSDNESLDYNSLGDEVNYDKIKGIDKQ